MRRTTILLFAFLLLASANLFSRTVDNELSTNLMNQYHQIRNTSAINDVAGVNMSQLLLEIKTNWEKVSDEVRKVYNTSYPNFNDFTDRYQEQGTDAYFCIWYKSPGYQVDGADTIRMADADNNGIPDYVDSVLTYLHKAINLYKSMGLNLPLPTSVSGDPLYDVFLSSECCGDNVYGFVFPYSFVGDNPNTSVVESQCYATQLVLRTNFDGSNWNLDHPKVQTALAVTATHEFGHAVQNTYSALMSTAIMEGLAVWAENRNYPTNYDGFMYAPTLFAYTNVPLNYLEKENETISHYAQIKWYSSWLWFKYVINRTSESFVKQLYDASIKNSEDISMYKAAFSEL